MQYAVESGDEPAFVVHKTGGGRNRLYEQEGNVSGTVIAGHEEFVGDERSPSEPCAGDQVALKFEGDEGEIRANTTKSFPDDVEADEEDNEDAVAGGPPSDLPGQSFLGVLGGAGLVAALAFRRR